MTEAIEFGLVGIRALLIPLGLAAIVFGLRRGQRRPLVIGVACLVLSGALWWPTLAEFWRVDRCLDAGGRYDYHAQACEGERDA